MKRLPMVVGVVLLQTMPAYAERVSGHVHFGERPVRAHLRALVPPVAVRCPRDPVEWAERVSHPAKVLAEGDADALGEFALDYQPEPGVKLELSARGYRTVLHDPSVAGSGYALSEAERVTVALNEPKGRAAPTGASLEWFASAAELPQRAPSGSKPPWKVPQGSCVKVTAPGRATEVVWATHDVELFLEAAPRIVVTVVRDGQPLAAKVAVSEQNGHRRELEADGGVLVIDDVAPPYQLEACDGDRVASAKVERRDEAPVQLDLRPSATAVLATVLEPGDRMGAYFDEQSEIFDELIERANKRPTGAVKRSVTVTEGVHLLRVRRKWPSKRVDFTRWIDVKGTVPIDLDVRLPELAGTVYGPDGGVARAQVTVSSDLLVRCSGICGPVRPASQRVDTVDGGFSVAVPEPGEYRLTAWSPELGLARARVKVPGPKATLTLQPGADVAVKTRWSAELFEPETPAFVPPWPAPVRANADGGWAVLRNVWGRFRIDGLDDGGLVEVDDAGVRFSPRVDPPLPQVTGTITDEHGAPLDLKVCANGWPCVKASDGGFSLPVLPGFPDAVVSVEDKGWVSRAVTMRPGESAELKAVRWKRRSVKVKGSDGKPVTISEAYLKPKGDTLVLAEPRELRLSETGYVPAIFPKGSFDDVLVLDALPLRGQVKSRSGRALAGLAVAAICEDKLRDTSVKWARNYSDLGGLEWWTWYPDGFECVSRVAPVDSTGAFHFSSLTEPIVAFELHGEKTVVRVPYQPGQPVVLEIP